MRGDPVRLLNAPAAGAGTAALLSGAAALVHQLLWVRRIGDLTGHGAPAVAVVLATFFAGVGIGARLGGALALRTRRPGLAYLAIEALIAAWALAFLPLVGAAETLHLALTPIEAGLSLRLGAAVVLACLLLMPPCLALGATLPLLVRAAAARRPGAGVDVAERAAAAGGDDERVAWLYGLNTLGAALGAAAALFVLLPRFGTARALQIAAAANLVAGLAVAALAGFARPAESLRSPHAGATSRRARRWLAVAALSGFVGIGCEIVWTRALAARLSSTVYSFAILLTVFLAALGLGSLAVGLLERRRAVTPRAVAWILIAAAVAILGSTWTIDAFGESIRRAAGSDLRRVQAGEAWTAMLVMAGPCLALGAILPAVTALARAASGHAASFELGRVYVANTAGAVGAAGLVGFVALPVLGLTATLVALAALTAAAGFALLPLVVEQPLHRALRGHAIAGILLVGAVLVGVRDLRHWRSGPDDVLVAYAEGRAASVAVVELDGRRRVLKVDQTYRLGGERGRYPQHRQGLLPLLYGAEPAAALFLGVGTGSSVGAAAAFGAVAIDGVEILPEVLGMVGHFDAISEGLAARVRSESRVRLFARDARHWAAAAPRAYDVAVADLFVPWRPGEGAMYTREHFAHVRAALAPGGRFVQWLPLYQFGPGELATITATFLDVFPRAIGVWLYFNPRTPTFGLVGSDGAIGLDAAFLERAFADSDRAALLEGAGLDGPADVAATFWGDRAALEAIAGDAPIETVDRPRIEFQAARHQTASSLRLAAANLEVLLGERSAADAPPPFVAAVEGGPGRYRAAVATLRAGLEREHRGDPDRALGFATASLSAAPDWAWARRRFDREVRDALERGAFEPAERSLDAVRAALGDDPLALRLAARLAEQRGNRPAAIALARRAIEAEPEDVDTRIFLDRLLRPAAERDR